jgi:hypothetical protein
MRSSAAPGGRRAARAAHRRSARRGGRGAAPARPERRCGLPRAWLADGDAGTELDPRIDHHRAHRALPAGPPARRPAGWLATSALTPVSANPETARRATDGSPSKAPPPPGTYSSKAPGRRSRPQARCTRSTCASKPAASADRDRRRHPQTHDPHLAPAHHTTGLRPSTPRARRPQAAPPRAADRRATTPPAANRGTEHRPAQQTPRAPRRSRLHRAHHRLEAMPTPHLTSQRQSPGRRAVASGAAGRSSGR